jgi:hypothetical protein
MKRRMLLAAQRFGDGCQIGLLTQSKKNGWNAMLQCAAHSRRSARTLAANFT